MPPMPAEAEAPPDLVTPLTASPACFGRARHRFELRDASAGRGSIRSRSGKSCASSASSASPAYLSSGATRAIATARSASAALPSPAMSLVETTAWRLPTSTRRPRSSPSARSLFLDRAVAHLDRQRHRRAPPPRRRHRRRRARAALTSRSARSVRAVWSNKDEAGARMRRLSDGPKTGFVATADCEHFAQARQDLVNHGSQRLVNHAAQSTAAPETINREH